MGKREKGSRREAKGRIKRTEVGYTKTKVLQYEIFESRLQTNGGNKATQVTWAYIDSFH